MRQYGIIFGILLLSIIDFALAAPIRAQEDLQASVDVPRDIITVVEKRGNDDLVEKLTAYFEKWTDPASPSSPPPGSGHEAISDAQTSSSPPPGFEHESTSDVQTSSSLPLEHEPMKSEQMSGLAPEPAPSTANPNPLVEPPDPLSTEPSTYTPVSTPPSSYKTTDSSSGSDGESSGTHVSQESYPSEWDFWLDPQNHPDQEGHMGQPDSPPSPPPPQNDVSLGSDVQPPPRQNGFAHEDDLLLQPPRLEWYQSGLVHGDDVQQLPQQNGFAHEDNVQQPPPQNSHQNGFAHGQMDDAAPTGPDNVWTEQQSLDAYQEWLDDGAGHHRAHVLPMSPPSPPPPQGFDGVQPGAEWPGGYSPNPDDSILYRIHRDPPPSP